MAHPFKNLQLLDSEKMEEEGLHNNNSYKEGRTTDADIIKPFHPLNLFPKRYAMFTDIEPEQWLPMLL